MQFADSQIFGKTSKRCMRILADFSEGKRARLQPKDCFPEVVQKLVDVWQTARDNFFSTWKRTDFHGRLL